MQAFAHGEMGHSQYFYPKKCMLGSLFQEIYHLTFSFYKEKLNQLFTFDHHYSQLSFHQCNLFDSDVFFEQFTVTKDCNKFRFNNKLYYLSTKSLT